jgi:hypothetical protein
MTPKMMLTRFFLMISMMSSQKAFAY